jgi:hypothetical protein
MAESTPKSSENMMNLAMCFLAGFGMGLYVYCQMNSKPLRESDFYAAAGPAVAPDDLGADGDRYEVGLDPSFLQPVSQAPKAAPKATGGGLSRRVTGGSKVFFNDIPNSQPSQYRPSMGKFTRNASAKAVQPREVPKAKGAPKGGAKGGSGGAFVKQSMAPEVDMRSGYVILPR